MSREKARKRGSSLSDGAEPTAIAFFICGSFCKRRISNFRAFLLRFCSVWLSTFFALFICRFDRRLFGVSQHETRIAPLTSRTISGSATTASDAQYAARKATAMRCDDCLFEATAAIRARAQFGATFFSSCFKFCERFVKTRAQAVTPLAVVARRSPATAMIDEAHNWRRRAALQSGRRPP